tara:strand:+ start:306 stop:533 length:228 start_codon:yes stop_codon:yes gene_type:complete
MDGNLTTFIRILNSIKEDGALEREDWLLLLPLMVRLVEQLRQQIDGRPFLVIALAGAQKVLEEVQEHVDGLQDEQ